MPSELFSNLAPTRVLHVTVGQGTGKGTVADPFHSIQAAVNAATPGTAIIVHDGVYKENIKISHRDSGTASAPIWLISGDGPQAATIKAVDAGKPVIQALGVDNYVIQGFALQGGYDGVQFSQSGSNFSNLVKNVLIKGNVITDMAHDGIKVGQADNVQILDNTISRVKGEEGIDLVAANDVLIARNDISEVGGSSAAIVAKGGSRNVTITANYIHDVVGDGISAGGNTSASSFRPGTLGVEAKNVDIIGNKIEDVGKRPISVRGAQDVDVVDNYLESSARYGNAVYVTHASHSGRKVATNDVLVSENVVAATKSVLKIDSGNNNKIVQSGNGPGQWSDDVGPDAVPVPGWARTATHLDELSPGDTLYSLSNTTSSVFGEDTNLREDDWSGEDGLLELNALGQDMGESGELATELPMLDPQLAFDGPVGLLDKLAWFAVPESTSYLM